MVLPGTIPASPRVCVQILDRGLLQNQRSDHRRDRPEEAKRQLLAAQSAAEHAAQMAIYHSARFKRLTLSIKAQEATQ